VKRKSWVARLRSVRTVSEKGEGDDDSEWVSEESEGGALGRDRRSAGADGSSSGAADGSASVAAEGSGSAAEAEAGSGQVEVVAVPLPNSPKRPD